MQLINQRQFIFLAFLAIAFLLVADPAVAGSAQGLPWEGPLEKIRNSMTGPVALGISLIGIVVAGGMLSLRVAQSCWYSCSRCLLPLIISSPRSLAQPVP